MARFLLILAMVAAFVQPARADDISAAARGVVRVVTIAFDGDQVGDFGHGSGFAIAPDRIVTNAHVVELAARDPAHVVIGIVPSQGDRTFRGRVVAYDPARDLAEIAFDGARLPPVTLYNGPMSDGAQVVALGYPGNVDLATAQSALDYITPLSPVRSQGVFSGARSLAGVRVLLHTAGIARGNSGGPLLDPCGRVIGVNSAITGGQDGDSSFAFAIADSELAQFLREAGQAYQSVGTPCTSIENRLAADAEAAEQERAAAEAAKRAHAQAEAMKQEQALADARAREERIAENFMALAAVLLVAGALAVGGATLLTTRGEKRHATWAGIAAAAFFVAAIAVFFSRPDGAVSLATAGLAGGTSGDTATPPAPSGRLLCRFVPERSRATVSSTEDVTIDWRPNGCVNGRTQYLPAGGTWQRVLVPDTEDTVSVLGFDPATSTYTATRYLLDSPAMAAARTARGEEPAACASGDAQRQALASHQAAIRATLPALPNEKLVYRCAPAPGSK
ncbi:trypsin-like peptidase [Hephaestia caeni]|uniref:Trypsin-like peptidase n=1 Tax=Hephaestia caeni TaxID=645617 RepID=A0A397NJT6_9SPHN|nr:trypsin-like peptidase domain-containing protein [Hephaestia caeni]RIA37790.1 trypsin-like peptidase [Hephaestia caeni]